MGILAEMMTSFRNEFRRGFDSQCGCSLPNKFEVLAVLEAGPASASRVARLLGVADHHRPTIALLLDELLADGRVSHLRGEYSVIRP